MLPLPIPLGTVTECYRTCYRKLPKLCYRNIISVIWHGFPSQIETQELENPKLGTPKNSMGLAIEDILAEEHDARNNIELQNYLYIKFLPNYPKWFGRNWPLFSDEIKPGLTFQREKDARWLLEDEEHSEFQKLVAKFRSSSSKYNKKRSRISD